MEIEAIAENWEEQPKILAWLKEQVVGAAHWDARKTAIEAIAQHWKDAPDTLPLLKNLVQQEKDRSVRSAAVETIAQVWKDDPHTYPWLKDLIQQNGHWDVCRTAVIAIAQGWKDDPDIIQLLLQVAVQDPFKREEEWQRNPRQIALQALLRQMPSDPQVIELLRDRVKNDNDEQLRKLAEKQLKKIDG